MSKFNATSNLIQPMPSAYRVVSITRLPKLCGRGVLNEAMLYHDDGPQCVTWYSTHVDCRLKRGSYVGIRGVDLQTDNTDVLHISRLDLLEKPLAKVNPFKTIPPSWVKDRTLTDRAAALWEQLPRPFQHLITAVFWDGSRFERFLTGPTSLANYRAVPNGNLRHAVETAEQVIALSASLPDIAPTVLITAALLQNAGKADDFQRDPTREGFVMSERGALIGYRHTILEWLAVARCRDGVVISESDYLSLLHILMAAHDHDATERSPKSIEAMVLYVADRETGDRSRNEPPVRQPRVLSLVR